MNIYAISLYCNIFLLIIISILVFTLYYSKKNKTYQVQVSQFKLMLTILLNIIETYRDQVYLPILERNSRSFDLDPTSKTNSIVAYTKMQNELLAKSATEILTRYTIPEVLTELKKCYNMEYLTLLIVTNLKKG